MNILAHKKIFVSLIIILLAIGGGVGVTVFSEKESPYDFVVVGKGNVVQEVNVTGRVTPLDSVSLSFETPGEVASIRVEVGDEVVAGDVLISLKNTQLLAQRAEAVAGVTRARATLRQMEATLEAEQATLAELERGARTEEINIKEINVLKTEIALVDAKNSLINTLKNAYTNADDAVRSKTDQIFKDPRTATPSLIVVPSSLPLKIDLITNRVIVEELLTEWKSEIDLLTIESDLLTALNTAESNFTIIKKLLDDAALTINTASPTTVVTQADIDKWKSDILAGRTGINTSVSSVTAVKQKLNLAETNMSLAEEELLLTKAGATIEQLTAARARVKQAEANMASQVAAVEEAQARVLSIDSNVEDTILRAPISGIVTLQDATVGEVVTPNMNVVSLISVGGFEVIAYVPEADFANLRKNATASITLDAYRGGEFFEAVVESIDPAETIIDGVATYKTTLLFTAEDERIKSGMTADIVIGGDRREDVILVPLRAVIGGNGKSVVRVLVDGDVVEKPVELGLRGSDGNIEILSGVTEGDKVIVFRRDR